MACQKHPYPTQHPALRALEAIRAAGKPGKQPVRAYPCEHCHHWRGQHGAEDWPHGRPVTPSSCVAPDVVSSPLGRLITASSLGPA